MIEELLIHGAQQFNEWQNTYKDEIKILKEALVENFVEAHHIGSTAINDIYAKPSIDIALIVQDLNDATILIDIGYQMKGEFNIPFRHFYSKKISNNQKIKIHVMLPGNHELDNFINFRDYLNRNENIRSQYSNMKFQIQNLLNQADNEEMFNRYTLSKNDMIVNFIKESGFDKICMRFVAHYSEQQYEKTICNKNNITINDGDIRVILYKGADIIGYAIATNNKIRFIYSEEKTTEFKSYFEKYLNHRAN